MVACPRTALNSSKYKGLMLESSFTFSETKKVFYPPRNHGYLIWKRKGRKGSTEATGASVFLVDPHAFQRRSAQTGPKRGVADEPEVTP